MFCALITVYVTSITEATWIYFAAIMQNRLQRCIAWGFSVIFYFRVLLKVFKSARYIKAILLGGSCGLCHSLIISQSLGAVTCSHTVTSLQADNGPVPRRSTWSPNNVIYFNVKGHTGRNFNFDFIVLFSRWNFNLTAHRLFSKQMLLSAGLILYWYACIVFNILHIPDCQVK